MVETKQEHLNSKAGSLEGELALLFGEDSLRLARTCEIRELRFTPHEIVRAAKAIRQCAADPAGQMEIVRLLPNDVRVALCKWVIDPDMKAKVLKETGVRLQ